MMTIVQRYHFDAIIITLLCYSFKVIIFTFSNDNIAQKSNSLGN